MPMYIIGIAGGTGSGKTTVARKIIESLPKGEVALIPQDSYYIDATDMTMEERRKINYDHPCAFDWKLLIRQVKELKAGRAIEQPTYSYLECNRLKETIHVEPRKVILIEGILALSNKELRDLMDIKNLCRCRLRRTPHPCHRTGYHRTGKNRTNGSGPLSGRTQTHASGIHRTDQTLCRPYHSPRRRKRESHRNHAYLHPTPSQSPFGTNGASSMKVRISEFGWKAGFRLCRKRPDLWKITSKRGQSGAKTKFLGSVLPNGSDLWKHNLLACLLTVLAVNLVSCGEKEEKKLSPLGITEEEYAKTAYDLDQIQEAGELIAVTLSGPDTYYEYKGKGFGLQFELAEHFAVSIGAKLRMEAVRDTAELFQRLKKGEADLIALEIPGEPHDRHGTAILRRPVVSVRQYGRSQNRMGRTKGCPLPGRSLGRMV